MENLTQRDYHKIFTGPEQNDGFENIYLSYEAQSTEVILPKDSTTVFHFPFLSESNSVYTSISASWLIEDGATAGPIPAAADKLYTVQRGYGNNTPWGSSMYTRNRVLHCTWLYSATGESPVWVDRYYTPGDLVHEDEVLSDVNTSSFHLSPSGLVQDVLSDRVFEPGCMYKYVHLGEEHAQTLVNTLSGIDDIHGLRLNINKWAVLDLCDLSEFNNTVYVQGDTTKVSFHETVPGEVDRYYLNLNSEDDALYTVPFNDSYNNSSEFSMLCWVRSDDWESVNTSRVYGNLFEGGYSLQFNNLKYTPYFFVAERNYSYVFCFNQNLKNYITVNLQKEYFTNITTYIVDGNRDLVVLDNITKTVYKLDHLGSSKHLIIDLKTFCNSCTSLEMYYIYADKENNYYVTTDKGLYYLNNELTTCTTTISTSCDINTRLAFDFNGGAVLVAGSRCALYTSDNTLLSIDTYGNFIINDEVALNCISFPNIVTFNIDPDGYIWLLYGINDIAKVTIIANTLVGIYTKKIGGSNFKQDTNIRHITFIYEQTRTGTYKWNVAMYSNVDKFIHFLTPELEEIYSKNLLWQTGTFIPLLTSVIACDPCVTDVENQPKTDITLCDSTDISGYCWSRVNNYVLYKNIKQLEFKVSLRNCHTSRFKTFTMSVPYTPLKSGYWQHTGVFLYNNTLTLCIDGASYATLTIPPDYFLNFNSCNSLYIGTFSGKKISLNEEIKITSLNYNACVDDLRIYNYRIKQELLILFRRAYFIAKDMTWNMRTAPIQYIDGIERFFQHKIPGNVSNFYKLKVKGYELVSDDDEANKNTQSIIEKHLIEISKEIQPAYTELLKIEWE